MELIYNCFIKPNRKRLNSELERNIIKDLLCILISPDLHSVERYTNICTNESISDSFTKYMQLSIQPVLDKQSKTFNNIDKNYKWPVLTLIPQLKKFATEFHYINYMLRNTLTLVYQFRLEFNSNLLRNNNNLLLSFELTDIPSSNNPLLIFVYNFNCEIVE